ncbi:ASCH/PUA domain-containing protein [Aeromonas hydrophila]|uniref:ASCH/PUA domain-containing protein n=1 Tax=Aeromonas hydrophila TaxID=644 RepID=UPI001C5AE21C
MKHELKIKPEYLAAIYFGEKTFEIRNNADRNFQVGDTLLLKAWDGEFTGDFVEKVVSYITDFEQQPGYVVLGLVNHREHELLEKFHRAGVAIERAISTGSVLADHPLKSRLELLANHHKREQELADGMVAMAERCTLLELLLREARNPLITAMDASSEDESAAIEDLIDHIDAALDGKLPEPHPDDAAVDRFAVVMKAKLASARAKGRSGWDDPAACSVEFLADLLVNHVGKGNPGNFEDIANLAMMLHQRGADPAVLAGKQVNDSWTSGVGAVAAMIEKKAEDYATEHGHEDMGLLSFGRSQAQADYYESLVELGEDVRRMLAAAPKPQGG